VDARLIKAAIFDGDGVLTDNRVLEGLPGSKPRWRSHYDGQGISLLRAIGIKICFITNETGESARAIKELIERWNYLPSTAMWGGVCLWTGRGGNAKVEIAQEWLSINGLDWGRCSVMGDDLVDVPMLRMASLKVAPITAEQVVLDMVDVVSVRPAGSGAIRDFANFVLQVRGVDPTTLPTQ
jgi:3-deoxy-D-manno-octulosonate 8-phosphate phosphatase (KDO 8-P phosphatase)